MTTRATPAAANASAAARSRTAPPVCTGTFTVAAMAATMSRLVASPVRRGVEVDHVDPRRALARRTTRPGRRDRRCRRSRGRSRPGAAARTARRSGRSRSRDRSQGHSARARGGPIGDRDEVGQQGEAGGARTSRDGTASPTPSRGRRRRRRWRRTRRWPRRRDRLRRERVHEVHPDRGWPARPSIAGAPTTSRRFHCICGRFTPSGSKRTWPSNTPRPARHRATPPSRRRASACRRRRRGTADRRLWRSRARSSRPEARSASMQRPKLPTPGNTTASASRIRPESAVRWASAPTRSSAFCAERRLPMP